MINFPVCIFKIYLMGVQCVKSSLDYIANVNASKGETLLQYRSTECYCYLFTMLFTFIKDHLLLMYKENISKPLLRVLIRLKSYYLSVITRVLINSFSRVSHVI